MTQRYSPIVLVASALAACTSTTIVEPFYRPENAQVEYVALSPNADFSVYRSLELTPLGIFYPENVPQPPQADLDRLRRYFREAFLAEFGDDYRIADTAGPDVLRVSAQIIDLKIVGAGGDYEPSARLREVVAAGELTLVMELQDSTTERALVRAADTTSTLNPDATTREADWSNVQQAAERWAAMFRRFVDMNMQGRGCPRLRSRARYRNAGPRSPPKMPIGPRGT
jgi:hypothetical protein